MPELPPTPWRCMNCDWPFGLCFEAKEPRCPSCKAGPPRVVKLTFVHFVYQDDRGPLVGSEGIRWRMACQPERAAYGNGTHGVSATCEPLAVTCFLCRKHVEFERQIREVANDPTAGSLKVWEPGCCG